MKFAIGVFTCVTAFGQITLINSASTSGHGASTTSPINATGCTPHCLVLVCHNASTAGYPATPVQDNQGNVYTEATQFNEDGDVRVSAWYAFGATLGTSMTWTFNGYGPAGTAFLFNNVASGPDQSARAEGSANPQNTGSVTPTNNDELVTACMGAYLGASYVVASPLTQVANFAYSASPQILGFSSSYVIQTTATAINPHWSWSGTAGVASIVDTWFSTAAPGPLSVTTTTMPEGFLTAAYHLQLVANGGVGPYTWTLTSGTLPTGLTLASNGLLSGTPTSTASATPLTFTVTDANSTTANSSGLTLTIASAPLSITFSPSPCPGGTQYASYAGCTVTAAGGTAPLTFGWSESNSYSALPEGLVLDTSTGIISSSLIGAQGNYLTAFVVTDALGATLTQTEPFAFIGSNAWAANIFPSNNIFYQRMDFATSGLPTSTNPQDQISSLYVAAALHPNFGSGTSANWPIGIPMIQVPYNQTLVPEANTVTPTYTCHFGTGTPNCPPSPLTAPIPTYAPIEQTSNAGNAVGNDTHVLVYQQAGGGNPASLWEMFHARPVTQTSIASWISSSNALWPNTGTNAITIQTVDAAGLPILPLILNADEVIGTGTPTTPNGTVTHMTRFTMSGNGANGSIGYYEWPATAFAGSISCYTGAGGTGTIVPHGQLNQAVPQASCWSTYYSQAWGPAFGVIFRLKASTVRPSCDATSPQSHVIITALYDYGVIFADNGSNGFIIGTPDPRWNNTDLNCLKQLHLSDFEPVNVSSLIVSNNSFQAGTGAGTVPTITTTCPLPSVGVNTPYSDTLTATGTPPFTWVITAGSLPTGLVLSSSTGVISGTPTSIGTSTFSFQATNIAGSSTNGPIACSIQVNITPVPFQLGGTAAMGGNVAAH